MGIKTDCEYYNSKTIPRDITGRNTLSTPESVTEHECNHEENLVAGLTGKPCNIENDYCPYNPKRAL